MSDIDEALEALERIQTIIITDEALAGSGAIYSGSDRERDVDTIRHALERQRVPSPDPRQRDGGLSEKQYIQREARERQRVPEGCSIVGDNVLRFLHGEAALFGERFHERAEKEKGAFWWRKFLPRPAAPEADEGVDIQTGHYRVEGDDD